MASKLERIYAQLPVSLQNVAVSVQGWLYNRGRYGKSYPQYVNSLMRSQWLNAEGFRELQTVQLRKLIQEAIEYVPYYRRMLEKFSRNIESVTLHTLKEMPFIETSLLRTDTKDFLNRQRLRFGHGEGHTSGTSGMPLIFPYDLESVRFNLAFRERQYRWAGFTGREKSARFSGRLLMGKHNTWPYWRYNLPENQLLFSSYHITAETLPDYYEALRGSDVTYLDGYPSSLFNIAKWICENNKQALWRPWAVFTTGEMLTDYYKSVIEEAFGCRVFNFYSSSEGSPFVTTCPAGRMHVNPESGIIEFLRANGSDAQRGEQAQMVVTSFFQKTLPLIRYRIGDVGVLAEQQHCPCGRQMPVVERIEGREDDVLYSSERGRVGSAGLSTVLYKIPGRLRQSQIEQIGDNCFVFRYVPLGNILSEQEKKIVLSELHSRLGKSAEVRFEQVTEIQKAARGKSQLVVGLKRSQSRKDL